MEPKRISWIDGMRGYAAIQVVLLHYSSALLPVLGLASSGIPHAKIEPYLAHSPFFFILNGYAAVWLFFLLSGVVLTGSFGAAPRAIISSIVRRIVRLGLPMVCAIFLGAILYSAWPHAHVQASQFTRSQMWLGSVSPPLSIRNILHQIFFEGLFTGYAGISIFPTARLSALGIHLLGVNVSFNAPLWTLHLEFVGSLLILGLVALKDQLAGWQHKTFAAMVLVLLIPTPLWLFVAGHLLHPFVYPTSAPRKNRPVGILLIIAGICLCTGTIAPGILKLAHFFALLHPPELDPLTRTQFMLAEFLLFLGFCLVPEAQSFLCRPLGRLLGKFSFSIYLVHFPVLFTVTSASFLAIFPRTRYGLAIFLASAIGLGVTFVLTLAFQRWVDQPAINLSRQAARFIAQRARHKI